MLQDRYGFALTTASAEARDAYVAGVDLSLSANHGAEEAFRRAIACDEGLAVAHVALARTLQVQHKPDAAKAVAAGFLLQEDAEALIRQADTSAVLKL